MEHTKTQGSVSTEKKSKLVFIQKPPKGKLPVLLLVFAWIAVCNVAFQFLHNSFHDLPIINWSFFISVTIFFMQEELSLKEKFWHTLVGGAVGLLLAAGVVAGTKILVVSMGLPMLAALCPLLVLAIGMLILLKLPLPMFFNNVGFCYFIISLIDSTTTIENLPKNLLSLLLGSLILNLGCIGIIKLYVKIKTSQMAK